MAPVMLRRSTDPDDLPGLDGLTTGEDTADRLASESCAFLRDLARVSDQSPNAFDVQLAATGEHTSPSGPAFPETRRFLVRRRLGAGGFGIVYEAFDRERNATVALKSLRRCDGRSISRFKNEFRALAETLHENLVQLYELHAEGDAWFFTMELVRGEDALAYVRPAGGPCDPQRLRAALAQVVAGLSCLHRAGKLHRDMKPSNVLVTGEGRVVIVDFGLVREIAALPVEGVVGTPAYMAPEQAAGLSAGTAADWYAVGVMLYEALTGRLPFPVAPAGAPGTDRVWPPPPPSALAADVPDDLDRLCIDLLNPTPELRPTERELRRCLAPGTSRREERSGGEAPFIGRATQLAQLRGALTTADLGAAVTVLLHGRSGMGKSALLQQFLGDVRARGPGRLVLAGRCFEQESVPYKGIDGLIDDLCRHLRERPRAEILAMLPADFPLLARLFPQLREVIELRPVAEGDDEPLLRLRAFAALRDLLARAQPAPVLVVDDLQWSDLDSTACLGALLHGPGRTPVLLVASFRAEEAETNPVLLSLFAALEALAGRVALRRVEVGELDEHEAEALSRAVLVADDRSGDGLAETTVQALVAAAHGDPFLLTELTRHEPGAEARTPELDTLLTARIGRLPGSARRLLEIVALEGQPVTRAIATRAAYGPALESEALGAIGLLRAGRLIRSRRTEAGEDLLPYHDRIREMVTRELDLDARRDHHHQLALALEATGAAEPERLLFHFRSAGQLGDAARHAADAARRAHEALAFDRAARLYRDALALGASHPGHDEPEGLRALLADALAGAGRPREAALAYLEAARGGAADKALAHRRRAAELLLGAGYVDEGLVTLRDVLRDLDVPLSLSLPRSLLGYAGQRVRLVLRGLEYRERSEEAVGEPTLLRVDACYAAALGLFIVNPLLAAEPQARHLRLALDAGEPQRVARAHAFEAIFSGIRRGTGVVTDRLLGTARDIEQRLGRAHLTGFVRLCEGLVAQISAQFRRAHELVVESESVLRHCTGVSLEIDQARLRRTDLLWLLGEVTELARVTPVLVDEAHERGNRFFEMMLQLSAGSLLGLLAGRPDQARDVLAAALERWPHAPGSMLHIREIRARVRISLYEGRAQVALTEIEDGLTALRRTGILLARTATAELHILGAFAALSIDNVAAAVRHNRAVASLGVPWAKNAECIVKAGLLRRAGDLDGAIILLRRAREHAIEREEAFFSAALSRRMGEWIGGPEGRAQVEAADAWMVGQGIAAPERMTALSFGWV